MSEQTQVEVAAKPRKLRDGSWGAAVTEQVEIGDVLRVTTARGKSWLTAVTEIVWTDDESVWIVRTGLERNVRDPNDTRECCVTRGRRCHPCELNIYGDCEWCPIHGDD